MNKNNILKDYGWCQIIKRQGKYIICYDKGGVAVQMVENEISKDEANKALINQLEAEKVIIKIQKKEN